MPIGWDDVLFAYGGLRPLTDATGAGGDTYTASRASDYVDHARDGIQGLLTLTGGKYTTARGFAEQAFRAVARKLGRPTGPSRTARMPLHACATGPLDPYLATAVARHPGFAAETVRWIALQHGTDHDAVLGLAEADPHLATTLDGEGELLAQVVAATRWEMARTLPDIVLRRTGIGTLGDPGDEVLEQVAAVAASELGWDDQRRDAELDTTRRVLALPG